VNGNQAAFSWRYLTPIYMGSTLNPINSSVLATALVPIAAGLHVAIGQTVILVTSLYLASAIAQPTAGKLAEEFGPRRIFLIGIALVGIGGLLGGLGQNLTSLVISRILIGIGTSAGYPSGMLLIRRRADEAGLAKPPGGVLGGLQIAAMVTAALGLPIGGVLVDAWGWRTTFLINIPFALVAFAMATVWSPRDAPLKTGRRFRELAERIDLAGIVAFAAATSGVLGFLFSLPQPNWMWLALGVVLGAGFVAWELRASRPFLDVRLLVENGALGRTYLRYGLTTLCVYTVFYGLTQWLQAARHVPSREAGLLLLPMSILSIVIMRPISRRNLVRGPLVAASAASLLGSIGILLLGTENPIAWVVVITLLFGITLGTASSSNQLVLYSSVTAAQLGTASGLFRTFGYFGSIASTAMIGVVFHGGVNDRGLHVIAAIMIAVSVAALVLAVADPRLHRTSSSAPLGVTPAQPAVS
jgi:MFS family permease